ncbi:hypothetical protein TDB9533_03660 [Thalassocella blandensis]|nr:hypothetical protein TDB9533_03660 [Thalassocella blandensis]
MLELLKNKHMILAMFIAPVLAIVAYFATDHVVSTPPKPVQSGQSYPLAAKSNCRYESGLCTMKNGDIEIHFRAEKIENNQLTLSAQSSIAVQNVLVALSPEQQDTAPVAMQKNEADNNSWRITLSLPPSDTSSENTGAKVNKAAYDEGSSEAHHAHTVKDLMLRVAIQAEGATFFAETGTDFFNYETIFSRENFSNI